MHYRHSRSSKRHTYRKIFVITFILTVLSAIVYYVYLTYNFRSAPNNSANPELLFADEFSGTSLNSDNWVTCYNNFNSKYNGCSNHGNWESEWYKTSQVKVNEGYLTLAAKKQTVRGDNQLGYEQDYPYISGMVSSGSLDKVTPPKWSSTYGYYEARIMSPFGQGIWPAFWLLPIDASWPPEIDIMEVVGDKPNELINTYFWKDANGNVAKDSAQYVHDDNLSNDWHTYAVNWQPGYIEWYLDNKLIRRVDSKNVPSQPMHLILNLAVGGTLPGQPDDTTPEYAAMLVDYVRVYKTKSELDR